MKHKIETPPPGSKVITLDEWLDLKKAIVSGTLHSVIIAAVNLRLRECKDALVAVDNDLELRRTQGMGMACREFRTYLNGLKEAAESPNPREVLKNYGIYIKKEDSDDETS